MCQTHPGWYESAFASLAIGFLCSGCALTTAYIDVPYQTAGAPGAAVPGAANTVVAVAATDARNQDGENTNALAVAGLVVGTAVGARLGGAGVGQVEAALAGAGVGAAGGTEVESAAQNPTGIAYTVRLQEGRVLTVIEHRKPDAAIFPVGAAIRLETRG